MMNPCSDATARRSFQWLLPMLVLLLAGCQASREAISPRAQEYLEQAHTYLEQDMKYAALGSFGLALEENRQITQAHMGMGHLYRQWGQLPLAARAYQWALEISPNEYDPNYYLGLVKQLMGQFTEASRLYLRALVIRPDSAEANRQLAGTYLQMARPSDALAYARKAVSLPGADQAAWANLGAAHALLKQYKEAAEAYQYALGMGGEDRPELTLGLADALCHQNRFQQAVDLLVPLVKKQPLPLHYERLGYAQFRLNHVSAALANYQAALALDGRHTGALNGAGVCLMAQYLETDRKDPALKNQALGYWRESLKVDPDQPKIIDLVNRYHQM